MAVIVIAITNHRDDDNMISRPYKAYGGYVEPPPYETECYNELMKQADFQALEKKRFDAGWRPSLHTRVLSYATYNQSVIDSATKEINRRIEECRQRKIAQKGSGVVLPMPYTIFGLPDTIPLPWLIAGGLGLALIIVLATRR